jgi:thioredoxin-related protein
MILKQSIFIFLAVLLSQWVYAQPTTYAPGAIDSLQKVEKRNIVLYIYTDWCKFCQLMKRTTFKNKKIIALLNEKFWFTELDAESKQPFIFNGHLFQYKPTGDNTGIHSLAEQMGRVKGHGGYPLVSILNTRYEVVYQNDGFLSAFELEKILKAVLNEKDR